MAISEDATPDTDLLVHFDAFARVRLLVVGDLILDRYTCGDASRVSPEAPVVVLSSAHHEARLGGAAVVAHFLRGFGAAVTCAGVVGADEAGDLLKENLFAAGIGTGAVVTDPSRPTTVKHRFVGRAAGRHPHQILRVDQEKCDPLAEHIEHALLDVPGLDLSDFDAVLISDYAKGVCTTGLCQKTIGAARDRKVPVLVDPARGGDYAKYRGVTAIKPNRVEAELATGLAIKGPADARLAGQILCDKLELAMAIITLDRDGMALVESDGRAELFPARARNVYDITGAGDMALATLGAAIGSNVPTHEAVRLANAAAGLEVERFGVAPISLLELRNALCTNPCPRREKVVSPVELIQLASDRRAKGDRIVFTNGCFDLLHAGHVQCLQEAAQLGDVLIVALNSDRSVRALKGPGRPVTCQSDRAAMLAALECVNHVVVFDAVTPHDLLSAIRPDVLVKGGTYSPEQVTGHEVVDSYGGRVCVTSRVPGLSTSALISTVQQGGSISATRHPSRPVDAAAQRVTTS